MTSKFLNNGNSIDLSSLQDGSFSIYAKSIKVNDLTPSTNVSTDPNKFLNSSSAGSGDTTYVGVVPATNCILKASTSDGLSISNSSITDDGSVVITNATNGIKANKFSTPTGTDIQYLMANGSTLTASANSGNSNFYLYKTVNGQYTPPPISHEVIFNNSSQSLATFVFINHITRDDINVEVFFKQVSQLNDLYIQDQNNSLNYIRYNITGAPIPSTNYISIPVVMTSYGGNGNDTFGNYVNIMVAFFTNLSDVDTRLSSADTRISTVETKTQNQNATSGQTNVLGKLDIVGVSSQAVLGIQAYVPFYGYLETTYVVGYEFIPTVDIVINSFLMSSYFWTSDSTTKEMGIYRASDSVLMGSSTLTKTMMIPTYYGINCSIKLDAGVKYVLSSMFVGGYGANTDRYNSVSPTVSTYGTVISNVIGRRNISSVLSMPTTTTVAKDANFGNFIYTIVSQLTAPKFIVPSGLSTQFLKANGTVDDNTYLSSGGSIIPSVHSAYDVSDAFGNQYRYGYFTTGLRCPLYDAITVPLNLGTVMATAINIGRSNITTTISGFLNSINFSGLFTPSGLGNIDIMLRDSPFIGIQYVHGSGIYSTLSNSLYSSFGSTSSVASSPQPTQTNNFTRQLCCADWSFPSPANGQLCGYGSPLNTGAEVSTGYNFGLSAILGYNDANLSIGCQNFFGVYFSNTPPPLNSTTSLTSQVNYICFGSTATDANICIYSCGATVANYKKQVDLGVSFPSNRTAGAVSTDWFKLTMYFDEPSSRLYYKAVNTTLNVTVSSFVDVVLGVDFPLNIALYPMCFRAMSGNATNSSCRLRVQRFGVYY